EQVRRRRGRTPVARVPQAVRRPHAGCLAGGRDRQPLPAEGTGHGPLAARADRVQRGAGPAPGGEGRGGGRCAAADDDRQGEGQLAVIPAEQLVPGDVVAIEAGDIVPADGRLIKAATLEVAESALTGESLPVLKGTELVDGTDTPLGDRTDMVYMNTNVTRGAGELVVTATGMATEVGHISGMLQAEEAVKTPLTRQLDKLTQQIFLIAGVALIISVALSIARGETFNAVFTAAVAFAIGALPENLPAVVTTILAYGTQALAKAGAIMKRLQSTETLGSTSAINSDKTGTLTLNQMTAVQMTVIGRRYAIEGKGYSTDGQITRVAGQPEIGLDE